jgi:hypothetical protein
VVVVYKVDRLTRSLSDFAKLVELFEASRSNWAKESSTFKVSRPMLVVVLKAWVTETKETPCTKQFLQTGYSGHYAVFAAQAET